MRGLTPRQPGVAVGIAALIALGACSADPSGDAAAEPREAAAEDAGPAGVVANGHSGITGEGATQERSERGFYSWATGDTPEVRSIYMRMTSSTRRRRARSPTRAWAARPPPPLEAQARDALVQFTPRLVLVQTIDGDIRCNGSDAEHVPTFGENLAAALEVFTTESPDSTILMMDQPGRGPTGAAADFPPGPPAEDVATDPCGFIDLQGAT